MIRALRIGCGSFSSRGVGVLLLMDVIRKFFPGMMLLSEEICRARFVH